MSFYASYFVYNNICSAEYGLTISTLDDNSVTDYGGATVELVTESIARKPVNYLYGVNQKPALSIPITITVEDELSASQSSTISRWLFGQVNYKRLQILQPDMQYVYYNCIFVDPMIIKVGNIIRGYKANVICDSPFAWEEQSLFSYSYGKNIYTIEENIEINNTSDNADYTYPTIIATINIFGGYLSIINTSDNNRTFYLENLKPNEIIEIDNDKQFIVSSTGENRLSNFSSYGYKWFRYIPNVNYLILSGNIENINFVNKFSKKII